jgi:LPS-assembly protein
MPTPSRTLLAAGFGACLSVVAAQAAQAQTTVTQPTADAVAVSGGNWPRPAAPDAFGPARRPVDPEAIAEEAFRTEADRIPQSRRTGAQSGLPPVMAPVRTTLGEGEDQVVMEADSVGQGEEPNLVVATGNVVARQGGRTLRADRLVYNRATGLVRAFGNVTVIEADGASTFADELTVDDSLNTGVASDFAARFPDGGVVAASAAVRRAGDRNFLSRAIYTACPICKDGKDKPTWAIRARRAMQDERAQTIVYNDVVFEVEGVPVFYVPYFEHGDPSLGRRSGLLQPRPGQSSRFGLFWEQPYLWVIDPYSDLTIAPMVAQWVNPLLSAQYRRKFFSGDVVLEGSGTYERLFSKRNQKFGEEAWRSHIFGDGQFDINRNWRWGFAVERTTDDLYLTRYSIDQVQRTRGMVRAQNVRLLSQAYVEGSGERFYARALTASFQDLSGTPEADQVPLVAPLLEAVRTWKIGPMNGVLTATGGAVALSRSENQLDSARASLGLEWRGGAVLGRGLLVEPQLFARVDRYELRNRGGVAGSDDSFSRTLGLAALDVRWPLVRRDARATWTLEPRINLTVASRDDQAARVINEETPYFELDSTAIFRARAAAGHDLWAPGARVTAGLSAGVRLGDDLAASGFLGRQWRDEVGAAFTRGSNLDRTASDWVGEAELTWRSTARLTARLRFDGETGALARAEATGRVKFWRLDADLRYHEFTRETAGDARVNRELQGSTRFAITPNWRAFFAVNRDLLSQTNLQMQAGLLYNDDCTELRVFYEKLEQRNRFIEPSEAIRFQVAFKTLGVLDDAGFD